MVHRLEGLPAPGRPPYGLIPFLLTAEDYAGIHGHNERVSIQNLRMGSQILFELTRRLTAARY